MQPRHLIRSLEQLEFLEPIADRAAGVLGLVLRRGPVKDVLSGSRLGHPLHPALTDIPIGALSAATLLQVFGGAGADDTVDGLLVLGLASVLPSALSGASDWMDTSGPDRRLGLVHAAANSGASLMYVASLLSRRGGARRTGVAFSLLGAAVLAAGGYIGGHLVFARGIGVDHTVFEEPPGDWTRVARDGDVPERTPTALSAGGYQVFLYRDGQSLFALAEHCSHASGPLSEGEVDDQMCVTCPWHGSRFQMRDGAVVGGPATAPQPVLQARVRDGHIEVRASRG